MTSKERTKWETNKSRAFVKFILWSRNVHVPARCVELSPREQLFEEAAADARHGSAVDPHGGLVVGHAQHDLVPGAVEEARVSEVHFLLVSVDVWQADADQLLRGYQLHAELRLLGSVGHVQQIPREDLLLAAAERRLEGELRRNAVREYIECAGDQIRVLFQPIRPLCGQRTRDYRDSWVSQLTQLQMKRTD